MEEKKMYKEELPSTSGTASSAKQEQWSKLIEVNFCCSWVNTTTTTHKKGHDTTETTTIISHKCVSKETCFVYKQKKSYKPFSFSVSMTEWTKYGLVDQWDSCRQLAAGFWSHSEHCDVVSWGCTEKQCWCLTFILSKAKNWTRERFATGQISKQSLSTCFIYDCYHTLISAPLLYKSSLWMLQCKSSPKWKVW